MLYFPQNITKMDTEVYENEIGQTSITRPYILGSKSDGVTTRVI
jgi:hypothetical protein